MDKQRVLRAAGAVGAALVVAAGVANAALSQTDGSEARARIDIVVPADPGGGWDLVAREAQNAMRVNGIVANTQVVNLPGAGGTIGLAQTVRREGSATTLMTTGTVMIGGIIVNDSAQTLEDVVPIARVADDYEVFVVRDDSPLRDMDDLVDAWRTDPGSVAVGGGSLGGTDHLLAGLAAKDQGVDPAEVNYIPFAGGAQALTSLLSGSIDVGVSGYNEFSDQVEAGELRVLGVSAHERVEGLKEHPTLPEQGVDAVLPNWRGFMAPPGITEAERAELTAIVEEMVASPEWRDTLERNRWDDTFQTGPEFEAFLQEEIARITDVTEDLDLS
ncbi:tripartite tricarboxylate transporter substrate binding protein [Streptomonospora sp. S1-112]|uniref:Tripartite tricarboxylate transporter substrate binding protein n=1 Tax=Streptomonospora mangrovi TaxID=2883123 RepID=A0A9X3SQZ3_9ACTN|nr:tripartite tricarboxylate transporter substrate-binding protein [Streptomonospora mangrovi]MDA0566951.1 tripartite tricarboxylate transporter substrate binding protein [Streptomonospora mangrovi]